MKILFSLPIWGDVFAQRWIDRGYYSMLQLGNIPRLVMLGHEIEFQIFADEAAQSVLGRHIPGNYRPLPSTTHVGTRVKEAHQISLEYAFKNDQVFCPLVADMVYSGDFWSIVMSEIANNGARGVVTPFITVQEEFIDILKSMLHLPAGMVNLALETTGIAKGRNTWDTRPYPPHQISLSWCTGTAVMRNYLHLHMHACRPTHRPGTMQWSVDNDLGVIALDDPGQVHVLTDSSKLVYADVVIGGRTTDNDQEGRDPNPADRDPLDIYREWGREWGHDFGLDLFLHNFWYGEPTKTHRRIIENESDEVKEQIITTIREVMP